MSHSQKSFLLLSEAARQNEGPIGRAIGTAAGAIVPPLLGYHAGAAAGEPFAGMLDAPSNAGGGPGAMLGSLGSFPGGKFGGDVGDKLGDMAGRGAKRFWDFVRGKRAPKASDSDFEVRRLRDDERKPRHAQPSSLGRDDAPPLPHSGVPASVSRHGPLPTNDPAIDLTPDDFAEPELKASTQNWDTIPTRSPESDWVAKNGRRKGFDFDTWASRVTSGAGGGGPKQQASLAAHGDEIDALYQKGNTPAGIAAVLGDKGVDATAGGVKKFLASRGVSASDNPTDMTSVDDMSAGVPMNAADRPAYLAKQRAELGSNAKDERGTIDSLLGDIRADAEAGGLKKSQIRKMFLGALKRRHGYSDDEAAAHWTRAHRRHKRRSAPKDVPSDVAAESAVNESRQWGRASEWGLS